MIFDRIGKKIAEGAKEQIEKDIDWKGVLIGLSHVLEAGVFVLAVIAGSRGGSSASSSPVVINNYIYGGGNKHE